MKRVLKFAVIAAIVIAVIAAAAVYLHGVNIQVLNPKGPVARSERELMIIVLLLSLVVVVPVFVLLAVFSWRYREANVKAKYTPDWDHNSLAETIWWAIPSLIIVVLSVITWTSTHDLDPYKPLASVNPPITIQAVALDWKWLFIYPQQNIATVNQVSFPVNTPINFQISSDAPMNSFWIPQLGGQIYAMAGMSSQLHLMADSIGNFRGSSANLSGQGFAGMHFTATSTSSTDFSNWVQGVKQSPASLSLSSYDSLARPSENNAAAYYSLASPDLYNQIMMKYMTSGMGDMSMAGMQ